MNLFVVELNEGHTAQPDQIVDGCLAHAGYVIKYTRGEAIKKLACLVVKLNQLLVM